MAKITRCDRCGREYNEPMSLLPIRDGYTVVHNVGLNTEYVDLCEECKNELAHWLTDGATAANTDGRENVREEMRWVEVKDRLPEADDDYYVAYPILDNQFATDIGYFDGKEWYVGDFKTYGVIAWQMLPKPYIRGEELERGSDK